jgi:hypothetical protein
MNNFTNPFDTQIQNDQLNNINNSDLNTNNNNTNNTFSTKKLFNELLRSEIKNLECSLLLNGFPKFNDLFELIQNEYTINLLIERIKFILDLKTKENEYKIDLIERINRLENEKREFEIANNRLKGAIVDLTEKMKKQEKNFIDKRLKWKNKKQKLQIEKDQETKTNKKLLLREAQFNHEIKKREQLVNKLNEQVKKSYSTEKFNNNSNNNFSSSTSRAELTLSYSLNKSSLIYSSSNINNNNNTNNMNNNNNNNINSKILFLEELNKNIEVKHAHIIKDNILLKEFLGELHLKLKELVSIRKNIFLNYYKKTFGENFTNEENIDLDPCEIKPIFEDLNITDIIDTFNQNIIKIKEYLIKTEEMKLTNQDNNIVENSDVNNCEKIMINDKYVENLLKLSENYSRINKISFDIIDKMLKLKNLEYRNDIDSFISHFEHLNKNSFYEDYQEGKKYIDFIKENLSECTRFLNENSLNYIYRLDEELIKIKENENVIVQKHNKFLEDLKMEINDYERILDNGEAYIKI